MVFCGGRLLIGFGKSLNTAVEHSSQVLPHHTSIFAVLPTGLTFSVFFFFFSLAEYTTFNVDHVTLPTATSTLKYLTKQ